MCVWFVYKVSLCVWASVKTLIFLFWCNCWGRWDWRGWSCRGTYRDDSWSQQHDDEQDDDDNHNDHYDELHVLPPVGSCHLLRRVLEVLCLWRNTICRIIIQDAIVIAELLPSHITRWLTVDLSLNVKIPNFPFLESVSEHNFSVGTISRSAEPLFLPFSKTHAVTSENEEIYCVTVEASPQPAGPRIYPSDHRVVLRGPEFAPRSGSWCSSHHQPETAATSPGSFPPPEPMPPAPAWQRGSEKKNQFVTKRFFFKIYISILHLEETAGSATT